MADPSVMEALRRRKGRDGVKTLLVQPSSSSVSVSSASRDAHEAALSLPQLLQRGSASSSSTASSSSSSAPLLVKLAPNFFTLLPFDLLLHVCLMMDIDDVVRLSECSLSLYLLFKDEFWQRYFVVQWGQYYQISSNTQVGSCVSTPERFGGVFRNNKRTVSSLFFFSFPITLRSNAYVVWRQVSSSIPRFCRSLCNTPSFFIDFVEFGFSVRPRHGGIGVATPPLSFVTLTHPVCAHTHTHTSHHTSPHLISPHHTTPLHRSKARWAR